MAQARCDCCRTTASVRDVKTLQARGWALIGRSAEAPLMLCAVCGWQWMQAGRTVARILEASGHRRRLADWV